ncbi:MAG: hypothetical protein JSV92_01600 [archaeon]|nr:MAG: hypothetical protein JSV92_01600 [archaeon]
MAGIADVMNLTSQSSFFIYVIPWLLTFAIVYGILGHYNVPKNNSARTIIALVIAFFIMPIAGPVVGILGQLGMGMLILFAGVLFIMILFEITGTRHYVGIAEKGKKVDEKRHKITEVHYRSFGVAIAILVAMVFVGAGGLQYLGYNVSLGAINYPLVFFIGILVLIIWWMVKEGERQ